ncbi:MAG: STAS domain-containing protein [Terriglobales bacterium]
MVSMLRMEVEHAAGNACVRCDGGLLRGEGLERLAELAGNISAESIVIDLSNVPRIDAHGLGILVSIADRVRARGMGVSVTNAQPLVRAVIETCGLSALLSGHTNCCSPAA